MVVQKYPVRVGCERPSSGKLLKKQKERDKWVEERLTLWSEKASNGLNKDGIWRHNEQKMDTHKGMTHTA